MILKAFRLIIPTYILLSLNACGLSSSVNRSLQMTVDSLMLQQTNLAGTMAAMTQPAGEASYLHGTPTPVLEESIQPGETPLMTGTQPAIGSDTENTDALDEGMELRIKASKILLFEDMSGSRQIRYVKKALDEGGYAYLDVGSAKGWFKNQLLSSEDWDLIIAAAEARRDFGGEYFEFIREHVNRGSAAVIEFWNIDEAPVGRVKGLLDDCGVEFQSDWYDPDIRSVFWIKRDHPILHEPNEITSKLSEALPIWRGDIGDLLEIKSSNGAPSADAEIIAGTNALWEKDHGTLVSCMDGRLIIQTFGSHEYGMVEMVELWQNYVYQTLKNHHELKAPDMLASPPDDSSSSSDMNTPLPPDSIERGIGVDFTCGRLLKVRVPGYPNFQKDMFEHHAEGTFLILNLEVENLSMYPVQIWDEDYSVEGQLDGDKVLYYPDKAASGYLYITNPINLNQDQIQPGMWKTMLAFDVDPSGEDWVLNLKPGSESGMEICQVQIPLTK